MFNQTTDPMVAQRRQEYVESGAASSFMRQVFTNMGLGLFITAAAAWFVGSQTEWVYFLFTGPMRYVTLFSPVILVFIFSSRIWKMS